MRLTRRQFLQGAATALTVPATMVDAAVRQPPPAWLNEAPLRVRAGGLNLYQRRLQVVETVLMVRSDSMMRQRVRLFAPAAHDLGNETVTLTLLEGLALHVRWGEPVEVRAEWPNRNAPVPGCTMRVALRHPGEAWCSEGVEHFELRRGSRVNILHFQRLSETWP